MAKKTHAPERAGGAPRRRRSAERTIEQVADEAKVSVATVSKVFLDKNVQADKKATILAVARKLDFTPRVASPTIALAIGRTNPMLHAGYTTVLTQLVLEELARTHYPITVIPDADRNGEQLAKTLSHPSVRCVIAIVFSDTLKTVLREMEHAPPVVTLNHPIAGAVNVQTDHHEHGVMATELLCKLGHRRIAILTHEATTWGSAQRLEGHFETLRRYKIEPNPKLQIFSSDPAPGTAGGEKERRAAALAKLVAVRPTGVLSFAEDMGLAVAQHYAAAISEKQVSLIGLDDLPIWEGYYPPISAIRQPLDLMAREAAGEACLLAAQPRSLAVDRARNIVLPSRLEQRKSVANVSGRA